MDKLSNLPQFSGSKLPVFTRRSPGPPIANTRRVLLRRSKSVSDLKADNGLKRFLKVPMRIPTVTSSLSHKSRRRSQSVTSLEDPVHFEQARATAQSLSKLKLGQKSAEMAKHLGTVLDDPANFKHVKAQTQSSLTLKLRKRSKEVAKDIIKPKIAKMTAQDQKENSKPGSSKATLSKRPVDTAKSTFEVKTAKIVIQEQKENGKPVAPKKRIAPYDYKARFNALSERFEKFKTSHKDCQETVSLCEVLKSENDTMSQKLQQLEPDFEYVSNELNKYTTEFNALKHKHNHLKIEYTDLKANYTVVCEEHAVLKEQNDKYISIVRELEDTVDSQSKKLQTSDRERRVLHNLVQELKGNIRVFCRVRPALASEDHRVTCDISYTSDKLEIRNPRASNANVRTNGLMQEFTYDSVFSPEATQFEVFEDLDQLVQSALDGYHVCVFAYGQTGSGKTHTMQGDNTKEGRGMSPRSVESLFQRINDLKLIGWTYELQASFLEIYNETIKDLLNPMSKLPYDIKYNEGKGVTVTNLQITSIDSEKELQKLIKLAEQNRSVAVTDYHEHSSRSHAVTKIYLQGSHKDSKMVLIGSINLVDLAGSENAKRSTNETIVETKHINKSLAALSNVMLALNNKDNHIPYRDSKLTYLLGSCLGGNSKTLMFVNICPFEDCYGESINALRFAAKVKDIKTNFKKNKYVL